MDNKKYLKSAGIAVLTGCTSYLLFKNKKAFIAGAGVGFGASLWLMNEQKKNVREITKEVEEETAKEEEAFRKAGINISNPNETSSEVENKETEDNSVDNFKITLSDPKIPLTKRLMNVISEAADNNEDSWKHEDSEGVIDLFMDDDVKLNCINHYVDDNFIHVLNNRRRGHQFLELYIKVPAYVPNGKNATPTLKNYREGLIDYISRFWSDAGIKTPRPKVYTKGIKSWVSEKNCISAGNKFIPIEDFAPIEAEEYAEFATVKADGDVLPDGLSKMVSYYDEHEDELDEKSLISVSQYVIIEIEVRDGTACGCSILQVLQLMKSLVDWREVTITQNNGTGEQILGPYVFHPGQNLGEMYDMNFNIKYSLFPDEAFEQNIEED